MNSNKQILKALRLNFREGCLRRDKVCLYCGFEGELDVHHITPRKGMPNHGYALSNGVSLCKACHLAAEDALSRPNTRFDRAALYELINSNYEIAFKDSIKLATPIIE